MRLNILNLNDWPIWLVFVHFVFTFWIVTYSIILNKICLKGKSLKYVYSSIWKSQLRKKTKSWQTTWVMYLSGNLDAKKLFLNQFVDAAIPILVFLFNSILKLEQLVFFVTGCW